MSKNTAHNQAIANSLRAEMVGFAKQIQARAASFAMKAAVEETHRDSGRAAANWSLSFGTKAVDEAWSPAKYGDEIPVGGQVGQRGDGVGSSGILAAKGSYYGFNGSTGEPEPEGYLETMLGVGKAGQAKTVFLYNPILNTDIYKERATLKHSLEAAKEAASKAVQGAKRRGSKFR